MGLMYSTDGGCTPAPAPSPLIHTRKSSDQLDVPSMPDTSFPSHHPNIRHHGRLHLEVNHYPSSHRADTTNALQEHASLHDSSPGHAYRADSGARCFNVELYQAINPPCSGRIQRGRTSPCASSPGSSMDPSSSRKGNFFLHHCTFTEEYSATPAEAAEAAEPDELTSKANPSGIMPTLSAQVTVTHVDPGHGRMTPSACYSESSQSYQHTSATPSVKPNWGVEIGEDLGTWCFDCERTFHARKALNRHNDDVHSEKKKCYYLNCKFTYIGRRKLQNHLHKVHGKELPSRRRFNLTRKVASQDSK
jgi:hypothetical protein